MALTALGAECECWETGGFLRMVGGLARSAKLSVRSNISAVHQVFSQFDSHRPL